MTGKECESQITGINSQQYKQPGTGGEGRKINVKYGNEEKL